MSQVIKKRRIVIASILKPVDDTRLYEKLGVYIADSDWEVHIIGFAGHSKSDHKNIHQHNLKPFQRGNFWRWLKGFEALKIIHEVKPERIIINTPELLWVAVINRIFFGRKIYYDVLENYYRNVLHTPIYPIPTRWFLAVVTRMVERVTKPLITCFFLAEKSYAQEMDFMSPNIVLQNKPPLKIAEQFHRQKEFDFKTLLFTGTLAESTGVFEAIRLAKNLHQIADDVSLTIIGYTPISKTLSRIKKEITDCSFIKLIGGDYLVEHSVILKAIQDADYGIVIYPPNPSTAGSIPTKLFEYLALQLPVLINHSTASHQLVKESKAGYILTDYASTEELFKQLQIPVRPKLSNSIYWEYDAESLRSIF